MKEIYRSSGYREENVRRVYVSCQTIREDGENYTVFEVNEKSQTIRELIGDGSEIPDAIKQSAKELTGRWPNQVIWKDQIKLRAD